MKTMVLILLTLFALNTHAATEGGGGGNVVVCYDANKNIVDIELYDFWNTGEGREYNLTITRDSTTPYMVQFEQNMQRLEKVDKLLANYMRKMAQNFSPENIQNSKKVSLVPFLEDDGDGKHIVLPPDASTGSCAQVKIERMAQFKLKVKPHERQFLIKKDFWESASEDVKYALIQHEIIYQLAKSSFENSTVTGWHHDHDSRNTQYFNALISSAEFNAVNWKEYQRILKEDIGWARSKRDNLSLTIDGIPFNYNYFTYPEQYELDALFPDKKVKKGDVIFSRVKEEFSQTYNDTLFEFEYLGAVHYDIKNKEVLSLCGKLKNEILDYKGKFGSYDYLTGRDLTCIDFKTEPIPTKVHMPIGTSSITVLIRPYGSKYMDGKSICGFIQTKDPKIKRATLPTTFGTVELDTSYKVCFNKELLVTQGVVPTGAPTFIQINGSNLPLHKYNDGSFQSEEDYILFYTEYCGKNSGLFKKIGKKRYRLKGYYEIIYHKKSQTFDVIQREFKCNE